VNLNLQDELHDLGSFEEKGGSKTQDQDEA